MELIDPRVGNKLLTQVFNACFCILNRAQLDWTQRNFSKKNK
jgi:hypothetical protein